MLTVPYIAFHMEQRWSIYLTDPHFFVTHKMILGGAAAVFALSEFHRSYLIELCELQPERVFAVPIYHQNPFAEEVYHQYRPSVISTRTPSGNSSEFVDAHINTDDTGVNADVSTPNATANHSEPQVPSPALPPLATPSIIRDSDVAKFTSDVLFFGSSSPRRRRFTYATGRRSEKEPDIRLHFRSISWEDALFGGDRYYNESNAPYTYFLIIVCICL
jgi:hypothetical protein